MFPVWRLGLLVLACHLASTQNLGKGNGFGSTCQQADPMPHPYDTRRYFKCNNSVMREMACQNGYKFNPNTLRCESTKYRIIKNHFLDIQSNKWCFGGVLNRAITISKTIGATIIKWIKSHSIVRTTLRIVMSIIEKAVKSLCSYFMYICSSKTDKSWGGWFVDCQDCHNRPKNGMSENDMSNALAQGMSIGIKMTGSSSTRLTSSVNSIEDGKLEAVPLKMDLSRRQGSTPTEHHDSSARQEVPSTDNKNVVPPRQEEEHPSDNVKDPASTAKGKSEREDYANEGEDNDGALTRYGGKDPTCDPPVPICPIGTTKVYNMADPADCRYYYVCTPKGMFKRMCPLGYNLNPVHLVCMPAADAGCAQWIPPSHCIFEAIP